MSSFWSNIKLSDYFNNQINSRSAVSSFLNQKIDKENVILDFSDINFISRATAHELLSSVDKFANRGVKITFTNLNSQVESIIDKVDASRKDSFKKATFVNRISFSSEKEFNNFLLSL